VPLTEDGSTITDDTRIVATLPHHRLRPAAQGQGDLPRTWAGQGQTESEVLAAPCCPCEPYRELLDKELANPSTVAFSADCIGEVASEMAASLNPARCCC